MLEVLASRCLFLDFSHFVFFLWAGNLGVFTRDLGVFTRGLGVFTRGPHSCPSSGLPTAAVVGRLLRCCSSLLFVCIVILAPLQFLGLVLA